MPTVFHLFSSALLGDAENTNSKKMMPQRMLVICTCPPFGSDPSILSSVVPLPFHRLMYRCLIKLPPSAECLVKAHQVCGHGAITLNQFILKRQQRKLSIQHGVKVHQPCLVSIPGQKIGLPVGLHLDVLANGARIKKIPGNVWTETPGSTGPFQEIFA
jgi:hypothetical protein